MPVIIRIHPHKRSATIEIIDRAGHVLAVGGYATETTGYSEMLTAGQQFTERVWAVEGCNGIGRPDTAEADSAKHIPGGGSGSSGPTLIPPELVRGSSL
ncbi:hypothetical protein [Nocardia sp. NPDC059239]|uniref:hypothetical protein n=1 Tax=Nocardia sp. NPDC059239 TaxID=3346785 RepID=UPI0036AFBC92